MSCLSGRMGQTTVSGLLDANKWDQGSRKGCCKTLVGEGVELEINFFLKVLKFRIKLDFGFSVEIVNLQTV